MKPLCAGATPQGVTQFTGPIHRFVIDRRKPTLGALTHTAPTHIHSHTDTLPYLQKMFVCTHCETSIHSFFPLVHCKWTGLSIISLLVDVLHISYTSHNMVCSVEVPVKQIQNTEFLVNKIILAIAQQQMLLYF